MFFLSSCKQLEYLYLIPSARIWLRVETCLLIINRFCFSQGAGSDIFFPIGRQVALRSRLADIQNLPLHTARIRSRPENITVICMAGYDHGTPLENRVERSFHVKLGYSGRLIIQGLDHIFHSPSFSSELRLGFPVVSSHPIALKKLRIKPL